LKIFTGICQPPQIWNQLGWPARLNVNFTKSQAASVFWHGDDLSGMARRHSRLSSSVDVVKFHTLPKFAFDFRRRPD
jgi:hypothetical protein